MIRFLMILISAVLMPISIDVRAEGTDVVCGPWVRQVTENEFTLTWITKGRCLSWVETAPDDGTSFLACERPRTYRTVFGRRYAGRMHSVRITGLHAGQCCRYRIYAKELLDDNCSYSFLYGKELFTGKSGKVRTLDYSADTCRFSMLNDIHDRLNLYRELTAPVKVLSDDFLLLNGDIVTEATSTDTVAVHALGSIADIVQDLPVFFSRGNHECRGRASYHLDEVFGAPGGKLYYIFRQGPVGFVVLDAGEAKVDSSVEYSGVADFDPYRAEELEWLEHAVRDSLFAEAPVKVAVCHIPAVLFPDSRYAQIWINENFNPILNEAGVDLMLSGHHHEFMHVEAGKCGNDFPVIVNDDETRLDFTATADNINIRICDQSGDCLQTLSFDVR